MRRFLPVLVSLVTLACGGGSSPAAPTTTTTTTPANRPPSITAMSMTAFGIQELSTFSYSASASDPDGDPVTFTWDISGTPASGTSGTIRFSSGGNGTARVTATDSKGATATDTRAFVVGSATGRWTGSWGGWNMTSNLTQNASGLISGDYFDQLGAGRLDTAVANTIDASGQIRLRYKQAIFSDFTFTGQMDSSGRRITGVVNGSGAVNTPFTLNK